MITVSLNVSDYLHAQVLNCRQTTKRRVLTICFVLMAIVSGVVLFSHREFVLGGGVIGGVVGACISRFFVRTVYTPWKTRKVFKQQKALQRPFVMCWDDESLTWKSQAGENRTLWSDFTKWKESEVMFLLYFSDVVFLMVPKRAFESVKDEGGFRQKLDKVKKA